MVIGQETDICLSYFIFLDLILAIHFMSYRERSIIVSFAIIYIK